MIKLCKIYACANGTLGLNLSRAPWDPYPWISGVQQGSSAQRAGMRTGDTLLELNGCDILGQKISEIAAHIRQHWQSGANCITVVIWRNKADCGDCASEDEDPEGNAQQHGINQQSLQKFATCLQHIAQLLECPVCLEVIKPPGWQCCNGHVLCNNCRGRTVKCPVCRVPLGPRGRCLLSDKLFTLLAESFPCDNVKGNRTNSPMETRRCTPEFHNQPKMALATMQLEHQQQYQQQHQQHQQQQNKAKEIKRKVKSLRQQEGKVDKDGAEAAKRVQAEEMPAEKLRVQQRTNGREDAHAGNNNNNSNSICLPQRHTSRSGKVRRAPRDELEILKCQSEEEKELSNCANGAEDETVSSSAICNSNSSNNAMLTTDATSQCSQQSSSNLKLELKSSRATADEREQMRAGEITARSHVLQDDEVAIVNNGMPTNKVQQQQQQQQLQLQQPTEQQHQQYQNYHCPTGKSCCSYVETFATARGLMQATEAGLGAKNVAAPAAVVMGAAVCNNSNNNNNYYYCNLGVNNNSNNGDNKNNMHLNKKQNASNNMNYYNNNHNNHDNSNKSSTAWESTTTTTRITATTTTTAMHVNSCAVVEDELVNSTSPPVAASPATLGNLSNCSDCSRSLCYKKSRRQTPHRQLQATALQAPATEAAAPNRLSNPTDDVPHKRQGVVVNAVASLPSRSTSLVPPPLALCSEWQVLCHITRQHQMAVSQFYGTYGQRIHVDFLHNKSIACLNLIQQPQQQQQHTHCQQQQLTHANVLNYENVSNYKVDKFFLACIPLLEHDEDGGNATGANPTPTTTTITTTKATVKYAIFLWHLPAEKTAVATDAVIPSRDVRHFDAIIESQRTGIKWFGVAHALTRPWSAIQAEGHFLLHEKSAHAAAASDAFEVVIKMK